MEKQKEEEKEQQKKKAVNDCKIQEWLQIKREQVTISVKLPEWALIVKLSWDL